MTNSFQLIKIILFYYLISSFIKALVVKITGSYLVGILMIEASVFGIFFMYITYLLKEGVARIRLDWIKVLLLVILLLGIVQSIYFYTSFEETGLDLMVKAFASFRKYLFPLLLFGVFSSLLLSEFKKHDELVFDRILKVLNVVLFAAIAYQFAEVVLRQIPAFNTFYTEFLIAPAMNAEIGVSSQFGKFAELTKTYFPFGLRIKISRAFGIGLDYYLSGSIILLCYMYHALFAKRFKIISLFNAAAFFAILLTGTLQFILPFVIFNIYVLFKKSKSQKTFKIIIGILLLALALGFSSRIFDPVSGYGSLYAKLIPDIMQNLNMFVFGMGPIRTNLDIEKTLISEFGPSKAFMLENITDIGILAMALEIGLILYAMIFIFFIGAALSGGGIKALRVDQKENIRKLKFINLFSIIVLIAHYLILFSRATYIYYLLFLSMAYAYSVYLRDKRDEKSIS